MAKKLPPTDRKPLERPHRRFKIKFNGVGGLRLHIGFMRVGDLYARAHFPGTAIVM
jgi:hypothetical protein